MATKRTITRTWLWGGGVMGVGGLVILAGSLSLVAHVTNVTHDGKFKFTPDDFFWACVFTIVVGCVIACGGLITQLVAHRGAEVETRRLGDVRSFLTLRRGGILSVCIAFLTLVGMVIGVVANWGGTGIVLWVGFPLAVMVEWTVMLSYLISEPEAGPPRDVAPAPDVSGNGARRKAPTIGRSSG